MDESKKLAHDVMVTKRQVHSNRKEAKRLAKELIAKEQQKNLEDDSSSEDEEEEKQSIIPYLNFLFFLVPAKIEGSKKEKSFKDPNYFMEILPSTAHSELG